MRERENEEEEDARSFLSQKGAKGVFGVHFPGQKWIISYRKLP